jgi:hypothetical protein
MLTSGQVTHWYAIGWAAWVAVAGFPPALIGIFLAWRQAKSASDTAKATQAAMRNAQQQIRANQLMVFVPQLRWISAELDTAITTDDTKLALRQLDNWIWNIGFIRGLLAGTKGQERMLTRIQDSVALASEATNLLLEGNKTVLSVCISARAAIGTASDMLNTWIGEHSTKAPEGGLGGN